MRRADSLFARLFGVFLVAILLAHALAFLWFSHYGRPPPPPPSMAQHEAMRPPPPGPNIRGPLIVLGFQLLTLIVATVEDVTEQTRRAVLRQRGAGGERNRQRNERREAETVKIARHVTLRMPAYGRCRPGDR